MTENNNHQSVVKVLIVDDKIENLIALEKTLAPLKLDIIKATSGNEALKLLLESDFAVVILDVMMPGMDGFEVATLMHENESTKQIPILFLTAMNKSEKYYIHGMEVGAIDYLYKPIEPVILLNKVRIFVDLYRTKNDLKKTIGKLHNYQQELEDTNKKLKKLAEEDSLTQIANRRYFEMEFENLLKLAQQHQQGLALIFCDVDNFKAINDVYGHSAGDLVLKTLADRISKLLEKNENNIKLDIIARLGGDEFAVAIGNLHNQISNAELVAKEMLKAIEMPIINKQVKLSISISIGIASNQNVDNNMNSLMRAADAALYSAKNSGKNKYVVYHPKLGK